jgi:putative tryptophan/tyrosine transport system substrate-binding protein
MRLCTMGFVAPLALALLVVPLLAEGQSLSKVPRIGWLESGPHRSEINRQQLPFLQGLHELGWVEGQNLVIEYRWAAGNPERLPELAAELVQLKVDVIVAGDTRVIAAAQHATTTIPIVMTISADPIEDGFIASLARPGGNITGLTVLAPELAGKRLELLTAAIPGMARVAVLGQRRHYEWAALAEATQALGLQLHPFPVDSPEAFEGFDHGAGHSLLLLYDAKAPCSQKSKDFNGLVHYPSNTLYRFIINYNIPYHSYNYLIFFIFL